MSNCDTDAPTERFLRPEDSVSSWLSFLSKSLKEFKGFKVLQML